VFQQANSGQNGTPPAAFDLSHDQLVRVRSAREMFATLATGARLRVGR
jgi:hypothetical protein